MLIIGRVVRLEVDDKFLTPEGSLDIKKARPLLRTGSSKGMHFSTLQDLDAWEPFSAMFPDGKDPFKKEYAAR